MLIEANQIVELRDGREVFVDSVASSEPEDYQVFSIDAYEHDGSIVIKDELPVETIFVGRGIANNASQTKGADKFTYESTGRVIYLTDWITSDISEVVSIKY